MDTEKHFSFVAKFREDTPETPDTLFIAKPAQHDNNVIIVEFNSKTPPNTPPMEKYKQRKLLIDLCCDITDSTLKADNTEIKVYQDGTLRFSKSPKIADDDLRDSLEKLGIDFNPEIVITAGRSTRR